MRQHPAFLDFGAPRTPSAAPGPGRAAAVTPSPPSRRARHAAGPAPEAVLMVCTGNICRSAYGQRALQARLDGAGRLEVASMGSLPNQALRVPEALQTVAAERGVSGLADHRPTALLPAAVAEADLVLTAAQSHMAAVLREVPQVAHRTFTVLELAELVRRMDERTAGTWIELGAGVRAFAETAAHHRVLARSAGVVLDVADPFDRGREAYLAMADALDPALDVVAGALRRAARPIGGGPEASVT